jgi:hypothetical protein
MNVTLSNGVVVTSDWCGGTPMGSSLLCGELSIRIQSVLPLPSLSGNISFIFAFFIAHFLLVENTYKNPYSLKVVK